jgi:putative DNA primase/helicase
MKAAAASIPDKPLPAPLISDKSRPEIERLATLPVDDYEREREAAAEKLGIRRSVLDGLVRTIRAPTGSGRLHIKTVEPWAHPVDGAELLTEIAKTVARYVKLPGGGSEAVALWVLHSHAIEAAFLSPLLFVTSPVHGCGKTHLMLLLRELVQRPLPTSNISPAALFRVIEQSAPTVLVDDADSFAKLHEEFRNLLNCGHTRAMAYVIRSVGEEHEPASFNVFAAKAVAAIGRLHPTIMSRSIVVPLQRLTLSESVERLREDRLDHLAPLASRAARWALDHVEVLRTTDPDMPAELRDRHADNWRPLFAIADLAGHGWAATARNAARLLDEPDSDETAGLMLLADIRDLFDARQVDRLSGEDIVAHLHGLEDRPWNEFGRSGKPLSKNRLAALLKPFGVFPRGIRTGGATPRGYVLADFADAFARYLSPSEPQQCNNA